MMLINVSLGVTDAVTIGTRCITTTAVQRDIGIGIVIVARARRNSKMHAKQYVQSPVILVVTDAVTIGTRSITTMAVQRDIGISIVIVARAQQNSKIHAKQYVHSGHHKRLSVAKTHQLDLLCWWNNYSLCISFENFSFVG